MRDSKQLLDYCLRKYRGIIYYPRTGLWRVRIAADNKHYFIGDYENPDLGLAHRTAVKNYHKTHPDIPIAEIKKILFPPIKRHVLALTKLRIAMLNAYGPFCHCCKEAHLDFLTLEHINGDGADHRRTVGNRSESVLIDLRKRGWPQDGYTVLCMNCNWGSRKKGICPHNVVQRIPYPSSEKVAEGRHTTV